MHEDKYRIGDTVETKHHKDSQHIGMSAKIIAVDGGNNQYIIEEEFGKILHNIGGQDLEYYDEDNL